MKLDAKASSLLRALDGTCKLPFIIGNEFAADRSLNWDGLDYLEFFEIYRICLLRIVADAAYRAASGQKASFEASVALQELSEFDEFQHLSGRCSGYCTRLSNPTESPLGDYCKDTSRHSSIIRSIFYEVSVLTSVSLCIVLISLCLSSSEIVGLGLISLAAPILFEHLHLAVRQWLSALPIRQTCSSSSEKANDLLQDTVIAIPILICGREQINCFLANLEENSRVQADTQFALLIDFADADSPEITATETILLQQLISGIVGLEKTFGPRFNVVYRDRVLNLEESFYWGEQRKRGKVMSLNNLLLSCPSKLKHLLGAKINLNNKHNVMIIDEDCILDKSTLPMLAAALSSNPHAIMACPAVYPRYYIQSHLRPFSSGPKLRSYSFDVYGSTLFGGKGLYRVSEYQARLASSLKLDRVLSHDIVEGSWLQPLFVRDAVIYEAAPTTIAEMTIRSERWARGDFINLFHLIRQVFSADYSVFGPQKAAKAYTFLKAVSLISTMSLPLLMMWVCFDETYIRQRTFIVAVILYGFPATTFFLQLLLGRKPPPPNASKLVLSCIWFVYKQALFLLFSFHRAVHVAIALFGAFRAIILGRGFLRWRTAASKQIESTGTIELLVLVLSLSALVALNEVLTYPIFLLGLSWLIVCFKIHSWRGLKWFRYRG